MKIKTNDRELELFCRERSKEIYLSEHGKKKANVWICGDILLEDGAETKCKECGIICYYDAKMIENMTKNVKKICLKCAWKNHLNDMSALEQNIIKHRAKMEGWVR